MKRAWILMTALAGCGTAAFEDADGDGVTADLDCDDADPARFPGAVERCDEVDDDCDGDTRSEGAITFYPDATADGPLVESDGEVLDASGTVRLDRPGVLRLCAGEHEATLAVSVDGVLVVGRPAGGEVVLGAAGGALEVQDGVATHVAGISLRGGDAVGAVVVGEEASLVLEDVVTRGAVGPAYVVEAGGALEVVRGRVAGFEAVNGAGVQVAGGASLVVRGTAFEDLKAARGGAVFAGQDADILLRDVEAWAIDGGQGGALIAGDDVGPVVLERVDVHDVSAARGGAVDLTGGTSLVVAQSTFTDVEATDGSGGALRLEDVPGVELYRCAFTRTEAARDGGGVWWQGATTVSLAHVAFEDSVAGRDGGALWADGAQGLWSDIGVTRGEARDGGGLVLRASPIRIIGAAITGAVARRHGGGVAVQGGDPLLLESAITGCSAEQGGGVHADGGGHLVLSEGTFTGNTATRGGGLSLAGRRLTLEYGTWSDNTATAEGGFAWVGADGELGLDWTEVTDNVAPRGGGVSMADGGQVTAATMLEAVFLRNEATGADGGGAVFVGGGALSNDDTDYGTGADDNTPDDIATATGIRVSAGAGFGDPCSVDGCD